MRTESISEGLHEVVGLTVDDLLNILRGVMHLAPVHRQQIPRIIRFQHSYFDHACMLRLMLVAQRRTYHQYVCPGPSASLAASAGAADDNAAEHITSSAAVHQCVGIF